ncbi:MAG: hypothetical protein MAG581_01131 [Deltaproteobacteria bacterium]|jgi:mono/diheme cytochrome c family protein|nr:hypothetical protein [Deltaproteobacteria bacterium]
MRRYFLALLLLLLISSCEKKKQKQDEAESEQGQNKVNETIGSKSDIEKGRVVYFANCVACHNNNPKKQGSIGPQIFGSSKELLTKKIVLGKYPNHYKPKRTTNIMPLLPHLDQEISNLHAYINSP